MDSPPTSIVVAQNGSYNGDTFPSLLVMARLRQQCSECAAKLEEAEQRQGALKAELLEGPARSDIELRRKRTQGVLLAALAVLMMLGMTLQIMISLETFLPKNEFPTWWRWMVAMVLTCAIVMPIHFAFNYEDGDRQNRRWVRLLIILAAVAAVLGSVLLGIPRVLMILAGSNGQSIQGPTVQIIRDLAAQAQWFGTCASVLLGLALDIATGMASAKAWELLSDSLSPLQCHKKLARVSKEISMLKRQIEELYQKLALLVGTPANAQSQVQIPALPLPDSTGRSAIQGTTASSVALVPYSNGRPKS